MTVQDVATTVGEDNAGPRPQARRALGGALVVAVLAVVLDQASKALAVAQLTPGERVPLLDGVDLFPTAPVHSLACRVYATGSGFAGAPTREQLEVALRGAGDLASCAPVHGVDHRVSAL